MRDPQTRRMPWRTASRLKSTLAHRGRFYNIQVLAVALAAGLSGCAETSTGVDDPPNDDLDPRTYLMGFAPNAPRAELDLLLASIDSMSQVSDVTIVQQPVPWPELLAGASLDSLVEDRGGLTDYLRALGLQIIFLVDPLDGLDRRREDPGLIEAGRSILEPEIRDMHEEWVRRIAARVRPEYFGLASEINTLAARGDPVLYAEIKDLVNTLAPEVRAASPATSVFVSFQADEANGANAVIDPIIDHFALIDDYDIDALGLSSYPVFFYEDPADVPSDYFTRFDTATDLPLLMVEGGWSSEDVMWSPGDQQEQVDFLTKYELLLDSIDAEAWVMLTFTDLDIDALGLPPDRAQGLSNFAHMGVLDIDLQRKPAYTEWLRIFDRPHAN